MPESSGDLLERRGDLPERSRICSALARRRQRSREESDLSLSRGLGIGLDSLSPLRLITYPAFSSPVPAPA